MSLINMNGTTALNFVAQISGPSTDASVSLTPESLLLYCQSRLNALDSTIHQFFDDQKASNDGSRALGGLTNTLSGWSLGHKGGAQIDGEFGAQRDTDLNNHVDMGNHILDIYRSTTNPDARQKIAEAFTNI